MLNIYEKLTSRHGSHADQRRKYERAASRQKNMKGPAPSTEALPAGRIEFVYGSTLLGA